MPSKMIKRCKTAT